MTDAPKSTTLDIARVKDLLDIVEAASKHSTKLTSIVNVAMNELQDINEGMRQAAIVAKKAMEDKVAAETERKRKEAVAHEEANRPKPAPARVLTPEPAHDMSLGASRDAVHQDPNNRRDANVDLTDRRV